MEKSAPVVLKEIIEEENNAIALMDTMKLLIKIMKMFVWNALKDV